MRQRLQRGARRPLVAPLVPPATAVFRRPLAARLDAEVDKRLALVVAPPAHGKSVLLAQWATSHPNRTVAWLALDAADADDDANRFARHLCGALSASDGRGRDALLDGVQYGGQQMGQRFISDLLTDCASMRPTVLVLEDFHTLANGYLIAEIWSLIEHAPRQLHFLISARMDPAVPFQWLRLHDDVGQLRQEDLAFERDDAFELIRRIARCDPTDAQLDAMLARTQGWCGGLQLAALSLRHAPDAGAFIESFTADSHHVAGYLADHVLRQQPDQVRQFLMATAVLERLDASLCDALTEGHDGQEMLDLLHRESLFVSRHHNRRPWFAYHPLFRTLLLQRFRAEQPELEGVLLQRAAEWHQRHDDLETAVHYLALAGDSDRILAAVSEHGYGMYTRGRVAGLIRWLDALPAGAGRGRTHVALLEAAAHALAGNTLVADATLSGLEAAGALTRGEAMVADAVRVLSVHDRPVPERVVAAADRVLASVELVDPVDIPDILGLMTPHGLRQLSLLGRGAAEMYQGSRREARASLNAALAVADDSVVWEISASGVLAYLDSCDGRLRSAEQLGLRAVAIARQSAMTTHHSTTPAYLALAGVARERQELEAADAFLAGALVRLQQTHPSNLLSLYATERALGALAAGDPEAGLALIHEHRTCGAPTPPAVASRLRAAEVRLLAAMGETEQAARLLGPALSTPPDLRSVAVQLAVERSDLATARGVLAGWPADAGKRSSIERRLWKSVVLYDDGRESPARHTIADVVRDAEGEGHIRLFLDAGHHAIRLLAWLDRAAPSPYLRRIIDAPAPAPVRMHGRSSNAVETLSDREQVVLRYLPTRLTNAEIATELRVSINTLKTHLRHIYRKLDVDGRRAAITTAEALRLL